MLFLDWELLTNSTEIGISDWWSCKAAYQYDWKQYSIGITKQAITKWTPGKFEKRCKGINKKER